MPRTVFIDFDGTFADRGQVPIAHVDAVREARANGHQVLLCTGRPRSIVPTDLIDSVFSGLVGTAGAYVELDGQVLLDTRWPADIAVRALEFLDASGAAFLLEAPEAVYTTPEGGRRIEAMMSGVVWPEGSEPSENLILTGMQTPDTLSGVAFAKIAVFDCSVAVADLTTEISPLLTSVMNAMTGVAGHSGEIYLRHITKATGIDVVSAHLGLNRADVVAIGDSFNDLEMLEQAGISLAVEGSPEPVLAHADRVIPRPEDEGIVQAFVDLGLIAPR